ncbi:MAG TPA: hypothetical protein VE262_15210 [Blastocatellia bacterium]|nr:hypothetical protein [Blastocatellia bacterium]
MLSQEIKLKATPQTSHSRRASASLAAIILGVLLLPYGCAGKGTEAGDPSNANQSLTAGDNSFITSINGGEFSKEKERYEGGYRLEIEGTFPDPSAKAYIVVKPERQDYFHIQSSVVRTTGTNWIGQAFLGEPESGIGESFNIFALFTSETYREGEKLEREPEGARSAVIKYTRTQN